VLDDLSTRLGIDLPITRAIREVLDGHQIGHAIAEFMGRPPTGE
jgi:hypothetical protein